MNSKRLAFTFSIGIGTVAVLALLGLLGSPGTASTAGPTFTFPHTTKVEAAFSPSDVTPLHYVAITGTDSGDCSTPAGACRTIQYAVDVADDGGLIRIAAGVYTDLHARDGMTQVVYISKSVSLYGGYVPLFDTRPDPITRPTILDAQGRGRVIYIQGDITVTLTGLRITGGDATGDYDWPNIGTGGGVYATGATLIISGSHVYSNTASRDFDYYGYGGGLAFEESDVTLVDNLIQGNTGCSGCVYDDRCCRDGVGCGLFIGSSEFNIVDNQILSNTARISEEFLAAGGGVAIRSSSGQLVNNLIDGNVAGSGGTGWGGGVYFETGRDDSVTMRGNVVQNNVASSGGRDDGDGGGIFIISTGLHATADIRLENNVVQGNVAAVTGLGVGGGLFAVAQNNSTMTLAFLNNLVLSNTATFSGSYGGIGGGVGIGMVNADFKHNRFVGNSAGGGSAFYFYKSHVEQQADILRGNVARGFFDSFYEDPGSSLVFEVSDATASNLVVIDNRTTSTGTAILVLSSNVSLVHPTLARNTGGSGVHVADAIYSSPRTHSEVTITNTILVSHAVGITVTAGHTVTLNGVLWYSNTTNYDGEGHVTVANEYTGNPAFDTDGYHLTATSAAIGRGVSSGVYNDIDGEPRPIGNGYDLGADEFPAAMRVTKQTDTAPVLPGLPLTYTIRVTNTGIVTLNAIITDILPRWVTPTGDIAWQAVIPPPEGVWTKTLVVTVDKDYLGRLTNLVQVASAEGATGAASVTNRVGRLIYVPLLMRNGLLTTVTGEYSITGNPCTTDPCLPCLVLAVRVNGIYYHLTVNGGWLWCSGGDPPSWNGYTPDLGDWVTVTGYVSEHMDMYGRSYYNLEVVSLVPAQ